MFRISRVTQRMFIVGTLGFVVLFAACAGPTPAAPTSLKLKVASTVSPIRDYVATMLGIECHGPIQSKNF